MCEWLDIFSILQLEKYMKKNNERSKKDRLKKMFVFYTNDFLKIL